MSQQAGLPAFKKHSRVNIAAKELVTMAPLAGASSLPLVISPAVEGVDLFAWAEMRREQIRTLLLRHGALLFRGFPVTSPAEFDRFIATVSGESLQYMERSSPRSAVSGNIYTSTEYPAEHSIEMHCENSYQKTWPLKIFFYCLIQPESGGETPIADTRRVLARLSPAIQEKFESKGVLYVRNFGSGLGLPWQTVFQTSEKAPVEEYCSNAGITCEWYGEDCLRTRHLRKAIRNHPESGERVWFNHSLFFHVSSLGTEAKNVLLASMGENELPNNTYYGDGSSIEPEVLDQIRAAFRAETVAFPWKYGDILMLDNMLAAHGRAPYAGARKILVGMTEPVTD